MGGLNGGADDLEWNEEAARAALYKELDALYEGLRARGGSDASPILPRLRYLAWQVHCGGMTSSELGRYRAHLLAVVQSRRVPQDIAGQEFVALQSFATELEFPELGEKVKDRINSCIGRNTYLGKYGRGMIEAAPLQYESQKGSSTAERPRVAVPSIEHK